MAQNNQSRARKPRPETRGKAATERRSRLINATSTPTIERKLVLHTHQAQQVEDRVLLRTIDSMYAIDVILRIIGNSEDAEKVNEIIQNSISNVSGEIQAELERVKKLIADNAVDIQQAYSKPLERTVQITSPQAMRFVKLLEMFDELMRVVDALWLAGELSGAQKVAAGYRWQKLLVSTGNKVIKIETDARKAAVNKGKGDEVNAATGANVTEPVSEADGANVNEPASEADGEQSEEEPAPKSAKKKTKASSEDGNAPVSLGGGEGSPKIAAAPAV